MTKNQIDTQPGDKKPTSLHDCSSTGTLFNDLAVLRGDFILVGSQGKGLFSCSLRQSHSVSRLTNLGPDELKKSTVHEIIADERSGNYIVATDFGIDILRADLTTLGYSSRHSSDIVATEFTAIAVEEGNTIWASSFAGIYRLHASQASLIKELPGTSSPSIVGFSRSGEDIVIADYSGLFIARHHELSKGRSSSIDKLCDVPGGITAIARWRGGVVYGLRSGGAFELPVLSKGDPCKPSAISGDIGPISTIESDGDSLLIGTFGNGAFRFDSNNGLSKVEIADAVHSGHERVMQIEPVGGSGHLILTEGGMLAAPMQTGSSEALQKITKLMKGKIPWAASTHGSHLWLATPTDGVYTISLKDFPVRSPVIISHHRLAGELIQAIEAISDKQAIVSSTTGLFSLSTEGSVERTLQTAGDVAVRFDFGASQRDHAGIFFGGTGGFALVVPEKLKTSTSRSLHRITSYAIDSSEFQLYRPLNQLDKVVLNADNQRLTFKVGSLAPWATRDLKVRYRLQGFESNWSQGTAGNEISYTNLPPGFYEFQSQARTLGGDWGSEVVALSVEVLPAWWRSHWALLAYFIGAASLFSFIKHYYETALLSRRATQLAREMSATAEQAMEDMQEEVELQARLLENVTSRNVATLSWIAELVGRQADTLPDVLSSEMAKVSLERIQAFVCLEHALRYRHDRVLADLRSFIDECSALLLSRRKGERAVTLINEASDTLVDAEHAARIATVLYELLANALDHAFVDRQHGNFLRVALEFSRTPGAESLNATITVEDNGVGLPEGIAVEDYDSAGFSLIREVSAYYGGRLEHKASGTGTTLRIELPLPADALA